jgi:hypothetical protein
VFFPGNCIFAQQSGFHTCYLKTDRCFFARKR